MEVLIDGAHALGMLPLDLAALGADYFVSNCHKCGELREPRQAPAHLRSLEGAAGMAGHRIPSIPQRPLVPLLLAPPRRWLSAPRGSAFLHVQERHQGHVRPLIVSHGYGSGFVSDFIWSG